MRAAVADARPLAWHVTRDAEPVGQGFRTFNQMGRAHTDWMHWTGACQLLVKTNRIPAGFGNAGQTRIRLGIQHADFTMTWNIQGGFSPDEWHWCDVSGLAQPTTARILIEGAAGFQSPSVEVAVAMRS